MSVDMFQGWGTGQHGLTYAQRRHIRQLDREVAGLGSSVARQQEDTSLLRSQLATMHGSLEARLAGLTRVFDAFIELTDVRAVLAMFDEPAIVRYRSRQLLASLATQTDLTPAIRLPDTEVPGYWLVPAVRAIVALLSGGSTDPDRTEADIAAALALDAGKTSTLIAATAALAGRRDIAGTWLASALGDVEPGAAVTVRQRLLWREAAAGAFGPLGVARLENLLRNCLADRSSIDQQLMTRLQQMAPWHGRIAPFAGVPGVERALIAASALGALRALCVPAAAPPGPAEQTTSDSLGLLVRSLVDQGTDDEEPLLRRAAELRAIIEHRPATPMTDWNAPAGLPVELLLADVFDPDAGPAGVLARRILSAELTVIAARLAEAATIDPPGTATVELTHGAIEITAAGATTSQFDAVRATIDRAYPPIAIVDTPAGILAALAAAGLAVDGLFAGPALTAGIVVTSASLVAAVARLITRRSKRIEHAKDRADEQRHADLRIAKAVLDFSTSTERLVSIASTAVADRDTITVELARMPA